MPPARRVRGRVHARRRRFRRFRRFRRCWHPYHAPYHAPTRRRRDAPLATGEARRHRPKNPTSDHRFNDHFNHRFNHVLDHALLRLELTLLWNDLSNVHR